MKGSIKFWLATLWGVRLYLVWFALTNTGIEMRSFIMFFTIILYEILFLMLFDFSTTEKVEGNLFYKYNTIILSLWDGIKQFNKFLDNVI